MIAYEKDRAAAAKFTEAQIVFAPRQADTSTVVTEVCPKMGISEATFYNWNRGGGPQEVWRARCSPTSPAPTVGSGRRAEENQQLKQLVADLSLDKQMLQDVIKKKL